MRIDRLHIRNFKRFEERCFELHPRFTLLVGDNGVGKTTVLDALAVAAGVWLVDPPDSTLANSCRNILPGEIRLAAHRAGDRTRFAECLPVSIAAEGEIAGRRVEWRRQIRAGGSRTTNADAHDALSIIHHMFGRVRAGADVLCPVIAYYGAGRAWLPSRQRRREKSRHGPARRWEAFYDCLAERIRLGDIDGWFRREAIAAANRGGWRPGYEVVKRAVLRCVPEAEDIQFDPDREEMVLTIAGAAQPIGNLSAGQRMAVALIGDLAIKAVTQNAHLVSDGSSAANALPRVLRETPGLVLIDEIDVHLHPKWQRRVVRDLKETFPALQFVCTSHSPFVIQSLDDGELLTLDEQQESPGEYADRSIEDIAEDIQHVHVPQQSLRARQLADATARYFALLRDDAADAYELQMAEADYRRIAKRYSANPGLAAILELEALAKRNENDNEAR